MSFPLPQLGGRNLPRLWSARSVAPVIAISRERAGRVKGAERRSGPLTRPSAPAQSIAGATVGSASSELLHQSSNFRDVQEFAGPRHVHRLVLLAIEVSGCRVDGHDEFDVGGKRALEKTVVRFVPDDTELGQRI